MAAYKVFKVEGGYEIFWCPSAPIHYNDKVPYNGRIYEHRAAAYRRVSELNTKRDILEVRHPGLATILEHEGDYWAEHGHAEEWETTRAWILDFLAANPRLHVRWEPERGVVVRGAFAEPITLTQAPDGSLTSGEQQYVPELAVARR